ncbi:unnamed protein product, partial [Sphacelaria rigidula]
QAAQRAAELATHGATSASPKSGNVSGGNASSSSAGYGGGNGSGGAGSAASQKRGSTGSEWGSWALGKLTETLTSSALPSSGPVGAVGGTTASPPQSLSGLNTPQAMYNGVGGANVSASIPGSVAAAVAAGLPVGGGGGSDLGGDEMWQVRIVSPEHGNTTPCTPVPRPPCTPPSLDNEQDARETLSSTGPDDGANNPLAVAAAGAEASSSAANSGWDWDGLDDGLGDDDSSSAAIPVRVASLKLGGGAAKRGKTAAAAAGTGGGLGGGDAARRKEELARRREARK